MSKYKCASFFAGVGGIDLGFEQTKKFKTIYANEFDASPAKTFEANFKLKVDTRDIKEVNAEELPDFDVLLSGFPCQPFSISGEKQGFQDEKGRGELFFDMIRIMKVKKPRVAFFENVKNLVSHDNGNTFKVICKELDNIGYHYTYKVLNAMNYGNVAQNRERIYIIAFKNKEDLDNFQWPEPIKLRTSVKDLIDFESKFDEKYYYTAGKYKGDLYEKLVEAMKDDDLDNPAVYQWRRKYVRRNMSGVVPTLTANQGMGGHNVCLIKTKHGIRKMLPRECFNTQGFPKTFILPIDTKDSKLYKQAGNSVCVTVIKRIAQEIEKAMEKTNNRL